MSTADRGFAGQVAVVTGATGGIGRQLALDLAARGVRVVASGRNERNCTHLVEEIERNGGQALAVPADLADARQCEGIITAAVEGFGGIDLLFNNAGTIPRGTAEQTTDQMWQQALDINLTAVFRLSRQAIGIMAERGGGAIVNTASTWGIYPGPGHLAYCTTKAAVAAMTKAMGRDHAHQGIRINAVCPNEVDTPMLRSGFRQRGLDADRAIEQLNASVPLGRIAGASEIVAVMLFLASDQASYIAGETVEVTGAKAVY